MGCIYDPLRFNVCIDLPLICSHFRRLSELMIAGPVLEGYRCRTDGGSGARTRVRAYEAETNDYLLQEVWV